MMDSGKLNGSKSSSKLMNPWMLHFQKLALELKCPLCLSLFKRPVLLPCNHLFCNSCLADFTMVGSECAVCNIKYAKKDVRQLPFVENMVAIYRSLDASFCGSVFQQCSSDDMRVLEPCQASLNSSYSNKTIVKVPNNSPRSNGVEVAKRGLEDCGVSEMDVNQLTQSTPDSPPFCDTKDSENDCSDQDSEHALPSQRLGNSSLKRGSMENGSLKERMTQLRSESSASETDGLVRELKKQNNNTYGDDNIKLSTAHQNKLVESCSNLDLISGKHPGVLLPENADDSNTSICSFCQSSKTSEATGPMLHYANGDLVSGDAVKQSNVIHVHRICIDWAPQVYFVGEAVQNLTSEVARGSKLKCSKCGLKGAALGCFVKSCRRTYHVTCALEIATCRWDHKDYLLLCPGHAHVRFPSEKPGLKKRKIEKHPASSNLQSQQSNLLGASQDDRKKLVLCGSALSTEEKLLLINFASTIGATVTKYWTPDVTHVIAATDADGACTRTLKVLMAILNGQWILKMDWIKACMEVMSPVEEEPYEISLDNQGRHGGPKAGRLRALANEPKLFSGLNFYFSGDYMAAFREDLEELVEVGGGTVLRSKEEMEAKRHECEVASKMMVVYNLDPPQGYQLGEEVAILWDRLNEAEELAVHIGCQVIGHTWILESIASCQLQSFVS